jgi:hypothetical protein
LAGAPSFGGAVPAEFGTCWAWPRRTGLADVGAAIAVSWENRRYGSLHSLYADHSAAAACNNLELYNPRRVQQP